MYVDGNISEQFFPLFQDAANNKRLPFGLQRTDRSHYHLGRKGRKGRQSVQKRSNLSINLSQEKTWGKNMGTGAMFHY
jgi:hypothetical protein